MYVEVKCKVGFVFTFNNELHIIHIMFVICVSVAAGEYYRVNTTECNIRYYVYYCCSLRYSLALYQKEKIYLQY